MVSQATIKVIQTPEIIYARQHKIEILTSNDEKLVEKYTFVSRTFTQ